MAAVGSKAFTIMAVLAVMYLAPLLLLSSLSSSLSLGYWLDRSAAEGFEGYDADLLVQDYVGEDVNVVNFFAVRLGNKTAITGGKVVNNAHIFIFYAGHGGAGVLACESGNIFEGICPRGLNSTNDKVTFIDVTSLLSSLHGNSQYRNVKQEDVGLFSSWNGFRASPEGSFEKIYYQKQLLDVMAYRLHLENSIKLIGELLFGTEKGLEMLKTVRPAGQPLVDDWDCYESMVQTFQRDCMSRLEHGKPDVLFFANMCNAGVSKETMAKLSAQVCPKIPFGPFGRGFSA